jgi:hypothetical protein
VFLPLSGTAVTPKAVRVRFNKKQVTDAPSIDLDGELVAT